MSFNGWNSTNLLANNTFASYTQRNSPAFSTPTPAGYPSKIWQNITISGLTATQDVREVQYASAPASPTDLLEANDTGLNTYAQLAMRFRAVDRANLTGVWLYYTSSLAANLNIVNSSTNADTQPGGRPTIATYTLPAASKKWNFVKFNSPVTLHEGFYYWIVVNATGSGGALADWYYIADQGTGADAKCAAAYRGSWYDEDILHNVGGKPYLNFMLMYDVLPVSDTNVHVARAYSSPLKVAMNETNSITQLLSNTTRIPVGYSTFAFRANTSVTFTANWTARFANPQTGKVATTYRALQGLTFWNATFTSDSKPSSGLPKTVYNRTITVSTLSSNWQFDSNPANNITNTKPGSLTFTAQKISNTMFITQLGDVNGTAPWDADWTIKSKSLYSISASAPSEVIQGKRFNITVTSATLRPSNRSILIYDTTGGIVYNRTDLSVSSVPPVPYALSLNSTGYHDLIVFDKILDRGLNRLEASYLNVTWINVLTAYTRISLNATTVSATWGDTIPIKVNFQNATKLPPTVFPASPPPTFTVEGYGVTPFTPWGNNGSYLLNYPSSVLSSAGSYDLDVDASYPGGYANTTTLHLTLTKVQMNVTITSSQGAVLPYSNLPVTANLRYQKNGTLAQDGFNLNFNFTVTYTNASVRSTIVSRVTSSGAATGSLLAASDMQSINVNVTFAGDSIRGSASDTQAGINVPPLRTQLSLENATMSATWSQQIHIKAKFQNATQGTISNFPSSTLPVFTIGGDSVTSLVNEGSGWYSFNYSTSKLTSAGTKQLTISATYASIYANNSATLSLDLAWLPLVLSLNTNQNQTSVAAGSSIGVTAALKFQNGTTFPIESTIRFSFFVTYTNGSHTMFNHTKLTQSGIATDTFQATSDMKAINVTATYDRSATYEAATSGVINIPVTIPPPFPIIFVGGAGILGALAVIAGIVYYRSHQHRRAKRVKKESRLTEAASIAQLVVVHLASGRAVYSKNLGSEESVDPQLISGFLTANQAVLGEAFKRKIGATLKSADYGDYKVISHVGRYVMATLFSTDVPGKELQETLEKFTDKFEGKYADVLANWDGNMGAFKDAGDIAAEAFALSLCCPYMIDEDVASKTKLSGVETRVLREATKLSVERGFFWMPSIIDFLLSKEKVKRSRAVDILDALGKKGVIKILTLEEADGIAKAVAANR